MPRQTRSAFGNALEVHPELRKIEPERPELRPVPHPQERPSTPATGRSTRLSGRERLVVYELSRGRSTEEIAAALFVSPHTIRTHIKNVMRKLEARTRAHAVAIAIRDGAIEL